MSTCALVDLCRSTFVMAIPSVINSYCSGVATLQGHSQSNKQDLLYPLIGWKTTQLRNTVSLDWLEHMNSMCSKISFQQSWNIIGSIVKQSYYYTHQWYNASQPNITAPLHFCTGMLASWHTGLRHSKSPRLHGLTHERWHSWTRGPWQFGTSPHGHCFPPHIWQRTY